VPDVGVIRTGTARPGAGHPVVAAHRLRDWLTLLVPAAAALLLGGYQLGKLSLWRDEAYSVDAADRSFGQIFALLRHTDAVNGTYYLFMHPVIAVFGTSATAIRLPSLLATAAAAAMTAALGSLLARIAGLPAPRLTGLLAGLLFVAVPQTTRYAQDARAYAIVTMLVTIATYLLVRAMLSGTWRWWTGYALVIAAAGLFNLFSLLVVAAHAVTVLIIRVRRGGLESGTAPLRLWRWLVAAVAAGILLAPLAFLGFRQRGQISWLTKPGLRTVSNLFVSFAGSKPLVVPIAALALCGLVASLVARSGPSAAGGPATLAGEPAADRLAADRLATPAASPGGPANLAGGPATLAIVALPWLILPPVVMLAVSRFKPVYDERYVLFCRPALALLCAAGLAWLARVVSVALPSRRGRVLAWLPSVGILAVLAALLVTPQQAVRLQSSRLDDLRYDSAVVAAHGRPTDIVFYIPWNQRILGMGYPTPFRRLRDISLAVSPVKSDTLLGTEVSLATLHHRLRNVSRVWLVTSVSQGQLAALSGPVLRAELVLIQTMRLIGRWHANADVLSLYTVK
jgi:mannosyltransferase